MDSEECSICGLELNEKYTHELSCGHKFHYECLMKTFAHTPKKSYGKKKVLNSCPYCRKDCDYLPVVNGLKKLIVGVHFETIQEFIDENGILKLKNNSCQYILKKGKNKGKQCDKKCFLGYEYCKIHKKSLKLE